MIRLSVREQDELSLQERQQAVHKYFGGMSRRALWLDFNLATVMPTRQVHAIALDGSWQANWQLESGHVIFSGAVCRTIGRVTDPFLFMAVIEQLAENPRGLDQAWADELSRFYRGRRWL